MITGWVMCLVFTSTYTFMTNSLYDRSAIEALMKDMIGSKNVDETLADELLVVAFDYNSV